VIESFQEVLGVEHLAALTSMNNLASTWKGQGRDKEATALMKEYTHLKERVLGPDRI
jgi:hypothetical protein